MDLKARTVEGFERVFNQGDLAYVDEALGPWAVDHQEAGGTNFREHLKHVATSLRTAFPDLRFEVHEVIAEGNLVATRSTMSGTHQAPLALGPLAALDPRGARISVAHMHFFRYDDDGLLADLWHVWDLAALGRQLAPPDSAATA